MIFARNTFRFSNPPIMVSKTPIRNSSNVSHNRTHTITHSKGAYSPGPEGWTKEGCGTPAFVHLTMRVDTRVFGLPRRGNTHVGPGAHTCLHVLIPFSFWELSRPLRNSNPSLLPRLPSLLFEQSQPRRSPTYASASSSRHLPSTYPVIWILSIFRTSLALPHPPAIHQLPTSLPTAFLYPLLLLLPALLPLSTILQRYAHASSVRLRAALSSFIPYPTLLPTCVLPVARFPPSDVGRRVSRSARRSSWSRKNPWREAYTRVEQMIHVSLDHD